MKELAGSPILFLSRRPLAASFLCLSLLTGFTVWLSAVYHGARMQRAREHFRQARQLEAAHELQDASDHYRDALTLNNESIDYRQALVRVLISLGRVAEAENHLVELLEQQPAGGEANLMMARLAWRRGNITMARTHYQRAIYGVWPSEPLEHKTEARFELVDRLISAHFAGQAQVELLHAAQERPAGDPVLRRAGRLLLELDAPREAARVFAAMTTANAGDAASWTGLGESYVRLGEFTRARDAFQQALRIEQNSAEVGAMLQTTRLVLALDPNRTELSDRQRLNRSRSLIVRSLDHIEGCTGKSGLALTDVEQMQTAAAQSYLKTSVPRLVSRDAVDDALEIARSLWSIVVRVCPNGDVEPALRLVMERLQM